MPENYPVTNGEESESNSSVHFDRSEPSLLGVIGVLLAIAITFGLTGLVAWWFVESYMTPAEADVAHSSYTTPSGPLPKEPRLEPLDRYKSDMEGDVFARERTMENTLHSYGTTSDHGFVHIPIDKAIKIVITKLPSQPRSSPNVFKSYGLVEGGESNSGRAYQEAPSWFNSVH